MGVKSISHIKGEDYLEDKRILLLVTLDK